MLGNRATEVPAVRRPAARRLVAILGALLLTLLMTPSASLGQASTLEPWDCTPDGILFQFDSGDPESVVTFVDLVTGEPRTGFGTDGYTINAIGYNVLDGYIYGIGDGQILRIGADGQVEPLGVPDGVPTGGRHVGDVDENGHYWFSNGTDWWQVDLDPDSPDYFTLIESGAVTGGGIDDYAFADWVYVPQSDDYLYTVTSSRLTSEHQLFRFHRQDHTFEAVGDSLGFLGGGMGAIFADTDGFLYGSVNATGEIYRIDPDAADPEASRFAQGPSSQGNDGAMCTEAQIILDYGDAPATYDTLLSDDGPRHRLREFDPDTLTASLMLGSQVSTETDGQPSTDAGLDVVDDGVADDIILVEGQPVEVDVAVTNDTDEPATLVGWVDLASSGAFDDTDRSNVVEVPPNTSGTYTLSFGDGATAEDTYARFRLFPGQYPDASELQVTGAASAGEVEDYLVESGRVRFEKQIVEPTSGIQPGDTVTYRVTATNPTPADLTGLSFTDDLSEVVDDAVYNDDAAVVSGPGTVTDVPPDQLRWTGDLAAGQTAVVEYTITIDDPPGGDAMVRNGIVGEGPGSNCTDDPPTDPDCFTELPQPQVSAAKASDAPDTVEPGDVVTYDLTITNSGPGAATEMVVTDDLSGVVDDATYNGDATASDGTVTVDPDGEQLVWNGPLAPAGEPGDTVTVTYSVTVDGAHDLGDGQLANALMLPGCPDPPILDPDDPDFDEDCVEIVDVEAWTAVKTSDAPDPLEPGDTVTYTMTVANTGNVTLDDPDELPSVSDHLADVLDDATYNDDADAGGEGTLEYVAPELSWEGALEVDQVVTITYTATVNPADELGDGQVLNAVTGGTCPDPPVTDPDDPDFDPDCVTIDDVHAFTVTKTADAPDPTVPGDTVTYEVEVVNTGGTALTGEDVAAFRDDLTDVIDDAVYNEDADDGGQGNVAYNEPVLTWSGDLDPGERATIRYSVTVNPVDELGNGRLVNTLTGDGACLPDDVGCTTDTAIEAVQYEKTIVEPRDGQIHPGDRVTYQVTVSNLGGAELTEASFTDDLSDVLTSATWLDDVTVDIGELSYSAPILSWGGSLPVGATATVTYAVQLAPDTEVGSELHNVVIGDGPGSNCPSEASAENSCLAVLGVSAVPPPRLPFTGANVWRLALGAIALLATGHRMLVGTRGATV